MKGIDIATIVIIAANVLVSLKGFNDFSFFEKYKFNIAGIRRGEQIRMFTSGFLHVDFTHLLFNMITLYFFAGVVINALGTVQFVLIYLASLLVGNLLSFYFHKDEYHYSAVGASGAVTGILYAAILFYPDMGLYLFFIPIAIPAWIFGLVYLLYSIYGMKSRRGNIGHDAHFGGAIAGYVLTLGFAPGLFSTSLWIVIVLALPIILLFVLHKLGKI
ncbi:MAG TPA: rhomboid family intramembrane serine protease [Flavobacteriaceae bacterium]|jgi:membrane associated rhomboid family serine protease|nr:rhomboid family intramembrane serine protease [Flavobacteriaceae bacterium]MAY53240.1 rhomboid family intramembrane serine protease [Flavobacteriaceae bacterium]HBR55572.1 rhomboid family intramembrane serine protease [Flavobacteriaceae bacterium]HIB46753.1 rhomboid family intramembrane serine protease [Flavobacteriaceae bacterium]HIN98617.1 rhomboid family intramembrane serine protease [Flavobacteriaceae bacterium]|tara:strand:+ start:1960 stop:2610 length:651 start_codon:yes stop_codon:yes gene_type:complete